ncbi:MAG: RagB/SusD family nutrient uptake outer membrane protein [Anaerolineae bacterium]|nr:RagB/SusD family nutrient uptake outer membrane protein [Gemmatimonadaceae bacterium]
MIKHKFTRTLTAGALTLLAAGCSSDRLIVPDYQNPTSGQISSDPLSAIQFLATGILRQDRDIIGGYISGTGILGRESYNYTPTEGRNHSGWVQTVNSKSFGGVALWAGPYVNLRNIFTFVQVVEGASDATLSAAQKSAALGFAHTYEAWMLLYIINTRNEIGAVVEVQSDPRAISPFVSRDSVFNHIIGRLDQAYAELGTGGTAFPFAFDAGFTAPLAGATGTSFTSVANFRRVNRALAARVNAYRASLGIAGCGAPRSATCYATALTNLSQSFLSTTPADITSLGVFRPFSTAANEVQNPLRSGVAAIVAHFKVDSGVQSNGATRDLRFTRKITAFAGRNAAAPTIGVRTTFDHLQFTGAAAALPVLRNEELILLRAEAKWFTGDKAGAIADLDLVRTVSGGLAPYGAAGIAFTETQFIDALLYERRFSLFFEGHRWIDLRRFGRLSQLPLDLASHQIVTNLPVPQAECLIRGGDVPNNGCN